MRVFLLGILGFAISLPAQGLDTRRVGQECWKQSQLQAACGPLNDLIDATLSQCEVWREENGCGELLRHHPNLKDQILDCSNRTKVCEDLAFPTTNFISGCMDGFGGALTNLKDLALSVFSPLPRMPAEYAHQQEFFNSCDKNLDCRKALLSHYSIEMPESQIQMASTAQLWRYTIEPKLRKALRDGTYSSSWTVPWTGQAYQRAPARESAIEAVDRILRELGVKKECYTRKAVAEMGCYVFFSIVSPASAAGLTWKLAKLTKMISVARKARSLEKKAEQAASVAKAAPKLPIPPARAATSLGDLSHEEVSRIQQVVAAAQERTNVFLREAGLKDGDLPVDIVVVGSAAKAERRNPGANLPFGKGAGTKSDIDYVIPDRFLADEVFSYRNISRPEDTLQARLPEFPLGEVGGQLHHSIPDTNVPRIWFRYGQDPVYLPPGAPNLPMIE